MPFWVFSISCFSFFQFSRRPLNVFHNSICLNFSKYNIESNDGTKTIKKTFPAFPEAPERERHTHCERQITLFAIWKSGWREGRSHVIDNVQSLVRPPQRRRADCKGLKVESSLHHHKVEWLMNEFEISPFFCGAQHADLINKHSEER